MITHSARPDPLKAYRISFPLNVQREGKKIKFSTPVRWSPTTMSNSISISISFSGNKYDIESTSTSSLTELQIIIHSLTKVNPSRQCLIFKGKKLDLIKSSQSTLTSLGLINHSKLALIGTIDDELIKSNIANDQRLKKKAAYLYHSSHTTPQLRSTTIVSINDNDDAYSFQKIIPFPESVPCLNQRSKMLDRLSEDPAIRQIMISRKYQVGIL
jgi:hypothetical protein